MPRLRPETKKLKAAQALKDYADANFNQTQMARNLGISQSAVSNRLSRSYVVDAREEEARRLMEQAGIRPLKVYKTMNAQLEANKDDDADWQARDKAVDKCLRLMRHYPKDTVERNSLQIGVSENVMIFLQDPNDASRNTLPKNINTIAA